MTIKSVSHVGLIVKNLEKSVFFYHDVMGLALENSPSEPFSDAHEGVAMGVEGPNTSHMHREAFLRGPAGELIELIEITDPEPTAVPSTAACVGKLHLSFSVDSIHEWVEHLAQYGVTPFAEPQAFETVSGGIGYWAYLKDPDGIIFELQQL